MKGILWLVLLWISAVPALADGYVIRGTVLDAETKAPLAGANIIVVGSEPMVGAASDYDGNFRIPGLPAGRHELRISYLGYKERYLQNLQLTAGKELVLEIQLEESVAMSQEIVVKASEQQKRGTANNEMATVSVRSVSMDEARRYAGSLNDPARMAQNCAGVQGSSDARNDIIIRGNSPSGMLWRLEGIDIPNPSHYGQMGATGGPLSMLNSNLLSRSDFFTGAFPAEYGNATSGVFDLKLRKGNNEKREYMLQAGLNGAEVGLEGPLKKGALGSYLLNYRYSVMSVFQKMGIDIGTGDAVPRFQDLSFKVDVPTSSRGRFSVFGLGGTSAIGLKTQKKGEGEEGKMISALTRDTNMRTRTGIIGFSHLYFYDEKTSGRFTLSASAIRNLSQEDSISPAGSRIRYYNNNSANVTYRLGYTLNKKLNVRNSFQAGISSDLIEYNLDEELLHEGRLRQIRDRKGSTTLFQAYGQWQHKFSDNLSVVAGLRYLQFELSGHSAVEPRVGVIYQVNPRQQLSFGAGIHNQTQILPVYFNKFSRQGRNRQLSFTRSHQVVLGHSLAFTENLRLKSEMYFQYLDRLPVQSTRSSFSMTNAGADYGLVLHDNLVSKGKGRNYGLELTLERLFSQGYYVLATASLYQSQYQGSDQIWRNTVFNGNYVYNLLGGREFKVGPKSTLCLDLKATYAGGLRYTPIDLQASRKNGKVVYIEEKSYELRQPNYFRTDVKVTYRQNGKKITQEWALDLQNVTNKQNLFSQKFDAASGDLKDYYQLGIFPNLQYKVLF